MTFSQMIGFYLAIAGIGVSLSVILVCIIALMDKARRWFD